MPATDAPIPFSVASGGRFAAVEDGGDHQKRDADRDQHHDAAPGDQGRKRHREHQDGEAEPAQEPGRVGGGIDRGDGRARHGRREIEDGLRRERERLPHRTVAERLRRAL